jgi:hypothetical protein
VFTRCSTRAFADLFRKAGHPVIHHKVRDRILAPRRIGKVLRDRSGTIPNLRAPGPGQAHSAAKDQACRRTSSAKLLSPASGMV